MTDAQANVKQTQNLCTQADTSVYERQTYTMTHNKINTSLKRVKFFNLHLEQLWKWILFFYFRVRAEKKH